MGPGFGRRQLLAASLLTSISAAALIGVVSLSGCAESPATVAMHTAKSPANDHRPPSPFPTEPDDDTNSLLPQTVNVFGEVNGVAPRSVALSAEAAFQQHTFADEGYDSDVNVDPTGKWLLFASTRNSEHPSVYMQRVDGTAVTQLTDGAADDAYPVFSPDGKQVAFSSTRAGNWQIFLMDTDGRNVMELTSGPMQAIHPSFSPDGTRIAYCSVGGRSGQWELWTLDLKTSEKRMIGYGVFPVWSPDKTVSRLAFQRARQRGSRWFSLWTIDLIDGEGRRATEVAVSNNAAILSPTWSPDGRRLAFATVMQPGKGGESHKHPQTDIWTIEADGSNRQRMTDGHGTNLMPWWSNDNRIYFVSDRGGTESIWSVHTDPGRTMAVEAHAPVAVPPPPVKKESAVGAADTGEAAPR